MESDEAEHYFNLIKHEVFTLRVEWRLYRSLFGTNRETMELLNQVSGPTSQILERVLFERVLLGLRKLTDKFEVPRRGSKSVTIKGLPSAFSTHAAQIKMLVNQADRSCSFARNWSDKRIAHSDLDYKSGAVKLESASRKKVEDAILSIEAVVKEVSRFAYNTTLITQPVPPINDERAFLRTLYLGQKVINQRKEQEARLLSEKNYTELKKLDDHNREFPDWLNRSDPPFC